MTSGDLQVADTVLIRPIRRPGAGGQQVNLARTLETHPVHVHGGSTNCPTVDLMGFCVDMHCHLDRPRAESVTGIRMEGGKS